MITYKAEIQGTTALVYSFDAAKAYVAQQAGRTVRWVQNAEETAWHGYRSKQEASMADPNRPSGFIGRILASTHKDF